MPLADDLSSTLPGETISARAAARHTADRTTGRVVETLWIPRCMLGPSLTKAGTMGIMMWDCGGGHFTLATALSLLLFRCQHQRHRRRANAMTDALPRLRAALADRYTARSTLNRCAGPHRLRSSCGRGDGGGERQSPPMVFSGSRDGLLWFVRPEPEYRCIQAAPPNSSTISARRRLNVSGSSIITK
jgi:hypothetical protein